MGASLDLSPLGTSEWQARREGSGHFAWVCGFIWPSVFSYDLSPQPLPAFLSMRLLSNNNSNINPPFLSLKQLSNNNNNNNNSNNNNKNYNNNRDPTYLYTFRGNNSVKMVLALFWKKVYSKRKEFALVGYNEANRKSKKLSPL